MTTGSNGNVQPVYLCTAGAGYDGPTGLGTPNGVAAFGPVATTNDFSVAVSPTSATVAPGSGTTASVFTTTTSGSAQSVSLSASGLPSGVTASFSPATVTSGSSSTLTLATTAGNRGRGVPDHDHRHRHDRDAHDDVHVDRQQLDGERLLDLGQPDLGERHRGQQRDGDGVDRGHLGIRRIGVAQRRRPPVRRHGDVLARLGDVGVVVDADDRDVELGAGGHVCDHDHGHGRDGIPHDVVQPHRDGGEHLRGRPEARQPGLRVRPGVVELDERRDRPERAERAAHSGTWDAWLDGYGRSHTDTLSQTVTIPSGCSSYVLSFYLHIDSAERTTSVAYDKLTVTLGSTTLATYSNLNKASGYVLRSFNVAGFAGQTVTLTFTGTEDSSLQTSFVDRRHGADGRLIGRSGGPGREAGASAYAAYSELCVLQRRLFASPLTGSNRFHPLLTISLCTQLTATDGNDFGLFEAFLGLSNLPPVATVCARSAP